MIVYLGVFVIGLLTLGLVMGAALVGLGFKDYLLRNHAVASESLVWEDRGPTPLGDMRYTPQGLTWAEGRLIFANCWRDTRSRVYEIDPATMQVQRHFDMPPEAVHTSGLAWDGQWLWAVDHKSNRGYCIDLEASLAQGQIQLRGQFDTTLRGTSACCLMPWNGEQVLAISDFMHSRRTILVRHQQALAAGTAQGAIVFAYRNEGFSQGLEFINGYLFESENKRGHDAVNQIDLARLAVSEYARTATIRQYRAPYRGVEDLAWDGQRLWTSDEVNFRFFYAKLDPAPMPDPRHGDGKPA
jgi:glutamine cyclotransferase